ncbi:MAG: gluconate 2-dehydrogenase subunit 3 family protein [Limnobacter sp.]|uniref:gluconate 2-dehydrogenase subunit 3 family protein n=1 Tax=Limnobacter sp. TaxID=2003368 RepID=UPI003001D1E4
MRDLNQDELVAIRTIQRLTRRDFMKALGLTAIAVTSTTGLTSLVHAASQVPQGIKFMTGNEYQVMNRLMQVMLPTAGTKLVPTDKIPVMQTLDAALLATMEPHILQGLKGGIEYFNQGPKAKYGKTFVELNTQEAESFCDAWANSNEVPQRALAMGLKKLVGLAYWANPPTWEPLGYDGPVTVKWGLKSQGNTPLPKV